MDISIASQVTQELLEALERLIPQLTENHPPPSRADLSALVKSETSRLLLARLPDETGPIVGTLTVSTYRVPTGVRAVIEDVVVDRSARGQGVGEALMRRALDLAARAGAPGVALTSNPRREAANQLYRRLGFVRRETNAYYYKFPG
jgi:ribosomal protein S18 acetylase RimI-like enzyme